MTSLVGTGGRLLMLMVGWHAEKELGGIEDLA